MIKRKFRRVLLYFGSLVLFSIVSIIFVVVISFYTPDPVLKNLAPNVRDFVGKSIANIEVFDAMGDKAKILDHLEGRPIILSPIYTSCPGSCSIITSKLINVIGDMDGLGTSFNVLTFSFDPSDGSEDLLNFQNRWELNNDNWKVVSADSIDIIRLLSSVNFWVEKDEETGEYNHANTLIILSPMGKIAKYVYGLGPNKFYLEVGIDEAMKEEFSLSFNEEVILRFFTYDPMNKSFVLNWSLLITFFACGSAGIGLLTFLIERIFMN